MDQPLMRDYSGVSYHHTLTENPDARQFERHCHDYYELLYVVHGEGKYVVESMEYPLLSGTLLLLRPYEFHYVCPRRGVAYDRYVLHFRSDFPIDAAAALPLMFKDGEKGKHHPGMGVYFPSKRITEEIRSSFARLDAVRTCFEGVSNRSGKEATLIRAELTRILLLLSLAEPQPPESKEEDVIVRVIDYLNMNLMENLSLDEIAQRFFISKYYLCHAFRRQTGVSVFNYLCSKRIAMAQHLLENGEPATSVAYQVGFGNYSSFYRAYCKQTGHAPSEKQGK